MTEIKVAYNSVLNNFYFGEFFAGPILGVVCIGDVVSYFPHFLGKYCVYEKNVKNKGGLQFNFEKLLFREFSLRPFLGVLYTGCLEI